MSFIQVEGYLYYCLRERHVSARFRAQFALWFGGCARAVKHKEWVCKPGQQTETTPAPHISLSTISSQFPPSNWCFSGFYQLWSLWCTIVHYYFIQMWRANIKRSPHSDLNIWMFFHYHPMYEALKTNFLQLAEKCREKGGENQLTTLLNKFVSNVCFLSSPKTHEPQSQCFFSKISPHPTSLQFGNSALLTLRQKSYNFMAMTF